MNFKLPTQKDKYLVHACLEGPETGVYYRGKSEITNNEYVIINLPSYVEKLAIDFTIQLTPIYCGKEIKQLYTTEVENKLHAYLNNFLKQENSPDFIIFISNVRVGALWKNKFEKDGESKNYLSGNIFTFMMPENNLKIVIFEEKLQKEGIWSGSIFWSDEKKEIDQSLEIQENHIDDSSTEEIF
jgi:uncharacterized protein (DUF736 family)